MTLGEDNGVGLDGYYDLPNLAYCFPSIKADEYIQCLPLDFCSTDVESTYFQVYLLRMKYNILLRIPNARKN